MARAETRFSCHPGAAIWLTSVAAASASSRKRRVSSRIDFERTRFGGESKVRSLCRGPVHDVNRTSQELFEINLKAELLIKKVDAWWRGSELG